MPSFDPNPAAPGGASSASASDRPDAHTILLVEDNEDDVFLFQFALTNAGIHNPFQVVEDGERAVEYLSGAGQYADRVQYPFPAVIFLDVKLPYMSGFDVLKWIHSTLFTPNSALPTVPIIVLSSSNSPRDIELAAKFGAPYAVKPPTPDLFHRLATDFNFRWLTEKPAPHSAKDDAG